MAVTLSAAIERRNDGDSQVALGTFAIHRQNERHAIASSHAKTWPAGVDRRR
ncbi:hypothetical protein ACFFJ4_07205 [Xanthomonas dyei]|uniref:hypothetical protein n=1 Tax=Xanthomonas dyei TaxID=743699 RepID=UPI001304BCE6|nr:hypothetical protein [Xanthomonas dyei]